MHTLSLKYVYAGVVIGFTDSMVNYWLNKDEVVLQERQVE